MSINSKLVSFAQNDLVIGQSDTEREGIQTSIDQLQRKLFYQLGNSIKEFKIFGSYTRNTILPRKYDPNSDVDLMVVFDTTNGVKTPETYRKNILDAILDAYPNSVSKKDFPAIKLLLNHIMFDVVPSYHQQFIFVTGGTYYIPGPGNSWRSTTPNDINLELSRKNQSYGNNVIRNTIRLCKHWNAGADYPLESYQMEKLILSLHFWGMNDTYSWFINTMQSIAGHRPGVRQALDYITKYKGSWINDPNEEKQFEWLQKLLPGLE